MKHKKSPVDSHPNCMKSTEVFFYGYKSAFPQENQIEIIRVKRERIFKSRDYEHRG